MLASNKNARQAKEAHIEIILKMGLPSPVKLEAQKSLSFSSPRKRFTLLLTYKQELIPYNNYLVFNLTVVIITYSLEKQIFKITPLNVTRYLENIPKSFQLV